jgi:hypothetical protein
MFKTIWIFVGKFFAWYVFFILILFLGFNKPFAGMFRSVGTMVFKTMWHNVDVQYKPSYSAQGIAARLRDNDTQIQITNHNLRLPNGYPPMGSVGTNSRLQAYLPIAMMIALSLSLPLALKRSMFIMVIGLVLLCMWILFLLGFVVVVYGELSGIGWYGFSQESKQSMQEILEIILMNQIGLSYIIPFVLWIIIIVCTGDYRQIVMLLTEKEKSI